MTSKNVVEIDLSDLLQNDDPGKLLVWLQLVVNGNSIGDHVGIFVNPKVLDLVVPFFEVDLAPLPL